MIRDRPKIPPDYGVTKADAFIEWTHVEGRFVSERVYWIAVTDEAGRPHVRPIDGLYVDDALFVGGSPQTRWVSLIRPGTRVTVHLDGPEVTIWEGTVEVLQDVADGLAIRLAEASNAKYPEYRMTPSAYRHGVVTIRPTKVIAWTDITRDPTRFRFVG